MKVGSVMDFLNRVYCTTDIEKPLREAQSYSDKELENLHPEDLRDLTNELYVSIQLPIKRVYLVLAVVLVLTLVGLRIPLVMYLSIPIGCITVYVQLAVIAPALSQQKRLVTELGRRAADRSPNSPPQG